MRNLFLLILLFTSISIKAQVQFDRALNIPVHEGIQNLRFPWAGGINFPLISSIDLNNDGRLDMFLFDHQNNRVITFINNGNQNAELAWDYDPQYATQFPPINKFAFLYDYNCDNKEDFFTFSSAMQCAGIAVYKNISTGSNLQWAIVDSCLQETFVTQRQIIFTNGVALPHFNDMDGDGDMDILGYNTSPDGRVLYHKNYSKEHFGNCDSLDFRLETVCWGNFSLNIGGTNTVGSFHQPCRVASPTGQNSLIKFNYDPMPGSIQSDAAKRDDTVSSLCALDLDNDGNKELLIGDISSNNTLMVHNGGADMDYQDTLFPSSNTPAFFNGFHYHTYIDADNDGKKDLIVSPFDHENKNGIWLYKNTGIASPVFSLESNNFMQNNMIDVGEDACPVLFDYDCDNLLDLVISKAEFDSVNGAYKTGLYLYKNIGTISNPSFDLITKDFASLSTGALYTSPTYPAFGDLDGDGDKDMLIGREDGRFYYYQNIAPPCSPANFQGPVANYMHIDIGKYATPQLYDLDHDGKLDLICGMQRGYVAYFKNRGTGSASLFDSIPTSAQLGCIALQAPASSDGFTVPFLYDSLGQTRMLVSNELGNIYQYNNIDGNLTGCFNMAGTVYHPAESNRIRFNITVSGGDLNGDSLADIIVGQSTGGAEILYQHNPTSGIAYPGIIKPTFEVFPNPVNVKMAIRFYHLDHQPSVLQLFNSIGELLSEKLISDDYFEINTASMVTGIYFLQLTTGKYSLGRKIIIQH